MPLHQTLSAIAFLSLTSLGFGQQLDPRFTGQQCPPGYARQPNWVTCGDDASLQCGTLDVPLDYEDPTNTAKILRIPMVKRSGSGSDPTDATKRKAFIYNPGGPGGSGIDAVAGGAGDYVQQQLGGGIYDVIGFDPRGIALSNPFIDGNSANTNYFCPNNLDTQPYETTDQINAAVSFVTTQGRTCNTDPQGQWGQLIGTAFVARDVVAMAEALSSDKQVRYIGYSYGTLLGATLAQMFPSLMDRVILDGNINPLDYYYGLGDETVASADAAVQNFFRQCAANTNGRCALAGGTGSPETESTLVTKWDQYLQILYAQTPAANEQPYLAWYQAKSEMNTQLVQGPSTWSSYSTRLAKAWTKAGITVNGPTTRKKRAQIAAAGISAAAAEAAATAQDDQYALQAVTCGDFVKPAGTGPDSATFTTTRDTWKQRSIYMYDQYLTTQLQCFGWLARAKEQFYPQSGKTDTANPVLFVNTQYDPVTPELSARNSANTFARSGVLVSSGAGHCSNRQQSNTLNAQISVYVTTGQLPDTSPVFSPAVSNSFDVTNAPPVGTTDADNSQTEQGQNTASKKRSKFVFPRHLMNAPFESQYGKRQDQLVPVGCQPIGGTTTTTSMSSTSTGTSVTSSMTSSGTTSSGATTSTGTATSTLTSTTSSGTTVTTSYGGSFPTSTGSTLSSATSTGSSSNTWTTRTLSITTASISSMTTGTGQWETWKTVTTSEDSATWATWGTAAEQRTFTKYSTIASTVSRCPPQMAGCRDSVVTKTVEYTTLLPTITIYQAGFVEVCPTGLTTRIVTLTATCNDGCVSRPTGVPTGYTVTKVWCSACDKPGFVDVTTSAPSYQPTANPVNNNQAGAGPVSVWNSWSGDGAASSSTINTPTAASSTNNWDDWNGVTGLVSSMAPAAGSATGITWNQWNTGVSATATTTPAAATSVSNIKIYTGAATTQFISVGVLLMAVVAILLV